MREGVGVQLIVVVSHMEIYRYLLHRNLGGQTDNLDTVANISPAGNVTSS